MHNKNKLYKQRLKNNIGDSEDTVTHSKNEFTDLAANKTQRT